LLLASHEHMGLRAGLAQVALRVDEACITEKLLPRQLVFKD